MNLIDLLAKEGNGAVQVNQSPDKVPPIVMLAGPIKIWWNEWGSERHLEYTKWRDAVRVALVKSGCAVYSPHRAIQGSWNEKLQAINDMAITIANHIVILTPLGCPADGTEKEIKYAKEHKVNIIYAPPGNDKNIALLLENIHWSFLKGKGVRPAVWEE
jgi:hypothetical protein